MSDKERAAALNLYEMVTRDLRSRPKRDWNRCDIAMRDALVEMRPYLRDGNQGQQMTDLGTINVVVTAEPAQAKTPNSKQTSPLTYEEIRRQRAYQAIDTFDTINSFSSEHIGISII